MPVVIGLASTILVAAIAKSELFRLTHMPMRLDRKNRMVHVMRYDGTVLSAPWDEIFFNVGMGKYMKNAQLTYIAGHVLTSPGSPILKAKESFVLGGHYPTGFEPTYSLWEFFRRYMEEGPESALEGIPEVICLPLDREKESFAVGLAFLKFKCGGFSDIGGLLVSPIVLLQVCFRWLAMRTCKRPVWPKEIEDSCTIDPNDPWIRDVTTNPPHARFGY